MTRACAVVAALFIAGGRAAAQRPTTEGWPEIDVYAYESDNARAMLEMSKSTERDGPKHDASFGLYQDWLGLPAGVLRAGYRYTFSTRDASYRESRIVTAATFTVYRALGMRLVNRFRPELRWINGDPSYRLRDRLHLQKYSTDSTGWRWAPYGTLEGYYDSHFPDVAISKIGARAGTELHLLGRYAFDVYVARQESSRSQPTEVNALGLTATFTIGRHANLR